MIKILKTLSFFCLTVFINQTPLYTSTKTQSYQSAQQKPCLLTNETTPTNSSQSVNPNLVETNMEIIPISSELSKAFELLIQQMSKSLIHLPESFSQLTTTPRSKKIKKSMH